VLGLAVRLANDFLPPALLRLLRRIRRYRYGFFGRYSTYAEAGAAAGPAGYVDEAMIEAIVRGQRAAVPAPLPPTLEDRWLHLELALSHALDGAEDGCLRVLDFGGAAGTHYFDAMRWRERSGWPSARLVWHVCETPPMAAAAQAALGNEELSFHGSLEALEGTRYDLVYASGSLQYVPDAHQTWAQLAGLSHRWLALNRTPFVGGPRDLFAVQRAPVPGGGDATYPGRFLAEDPWLERIGRSHDLVVRWPVREPLPYFQRIRGVRYEGMLLRRQ
jgi:putative methyltransferase (TIGR04325 family)